MNPAGLRALCALRTLTLVALLVLPSAGGVWASPTVERDVAAVDAPDCVKAISRFRVVEAGFFRGARPDEEGILALKARGVRTVVAFLRDDDERARVLAAGMDYVELPITATVFGATVPTRAQQQEFLDIVGDPVRRPVFVHCKHGRDRTGVMVAFWRVVRGGWTPEDAIEEMQDFGLSLQYRNYRKFIRRLGAPTDA